MDIRLALLPFRARLGVLARRGDAAVADPAVELQPVFQRTPPLDELLGILRLFHVHAAVAGGPDQLVAVACGRSPNLALQPLARPFEKPDHSSLISEIAAGRCRRSRHTYWPKTRSDRFAAIMPAASSQISQICTSTRPSDRP